MSLITDAGEWSKLDIKDILKTSLSLLGFSSMTPVQKAVIPLFSNYKDVVVEAVTGSGKTLAFVVPIFEMLIRRYEQNRPLKKNEIGVVIITPTRELAKQIFQVVQDFLDLINENGHEFKQMLMVGGTDLLEDMKKFHLDGAHIVIGTPGRMDDLFSRQSIFNTKEVEVLVLDEADRLLDMGFERQLASIMQKIPKQRRTGLFSATMSEAVNDLIKAGLRNPYKVVIKVETAAGSEISEQKMPSSLDLRYIIVESDMKLATLIKFLETKKDAKSIVYFSTAACVDFYFKILNKLNITGIKFHSLHGKMVSKRRELTFKNFKNADKGSVLICTDVAARGLDIPDIDVVIQFDPPQDPKAFAHRCGRTARIGKQGVAIVFMHPNEDTYIEFLKIRKLPISEYEHDLICDNTDILEMIKAQNLEDRENLDRAVTAFVSYIRSYKGHQANFIFQLKELNVAAVANSFGLWKIPRMPELLALNIEFKETEIDLKSIKYKNKAKELKRQNEKPREKRVKKESWSIQKQRKLRKKAKNNKL